MSENISVEHQNGMWCIIDTDNMKTYVCGDGNLYRVQTPLTAYRQLKQTLTALKATVKPSEVYQLLKPYPIEALALGYADAALPEWKREKIRDYLLNLRKTQPFMTGDDLIALGEKPGKAFETVLSGLFAAQLDGKITTKSEAFCHLQGLKDHAP